MISRLTVLFTRAKQILQTEGFPPLVRRGFPFVVRRFFDYQTYYLYETALQEIPKEQNEADSLPRTQDFTLKIVSTNQEADELKAEGLQFRSHVSNSRERLEKGAIAFCIFIERELASVGWIATTQEAKDSLNEPPYKVDFSNKESCTGSSVTDPKYRGMGLMAYSLFKRFEFLRERGRVRDRAAVAKSNIASKMGGAKVGSQIHAEARYLRILWWESWKERPLP